MTKNEICIAIGKGNPTFSDYKKLSGLRIGQRKDFKMHANLDGITASASIRTPIGTEFTCYFICGDAESLRKSAGEMGHKFQKELEHEYAEMFHSSQDAYEWMLGVADSE